MQSEIQIPNSEKRTGFTLIEILIAIVIIVILAAIGIGVGYKLTSAADVEQTKADMTLIMNAVKDYYDQNGAYPARASDDDEDEDYYRIRVRYTDINGVPLPSYERFTGKLKEISNEVVQTGFIDVSGNIRDAVFNLVDSEGRQIRYVRDGGIGGTPLLISPGEDGLYGPDGKDSKERKAWGEDDIRSDK